MVVHLGNSFTASDASGFFDPAGDWHYSQIVWRFQYDKNYRNGVIVVLPTITHAQAI
jgi:hypothetical protein